MTDATLMHLAGTARRQRDAGPPGSAAAPGTPPSPRLVQRWQRLWAQDPAAPPGLEPGRFAAVAAALGETPFALEVPGPEGGGLIVGRRRRGPLPRRLGYMPLGTPPLRSLVVAAGGVLGPVPAETAAARLAAMLAAGEADHVMAYRVAAGSPLAGALLDQPRALADPAAPHWHLALGESYEATLGRHSARHRKRLRWEARRLAEAFGGRVEVRTHAEASELAPGLALAAAISRASYHAGAGGLVEDNPVWRAQLAPAAAAGRLRLHVMTGAGEPVAALVGANEGRTLHVLAMAYLPRHGALSPGKHLLLHAIRRACEDGLERVDFGIGDAGYKRVYGSGRVDEATVHLFGGGAAARGAWLLCRGLAGADDLLRRAAGSRGTERLRAAWRRALEPRQGG